MILHTLNLILLITLSIVDAVFAPISYFKKLLAYNIFIKTLNFITYGPCYVQAVLKHLKIKRQRLIGLVRLKKAIPIKSSKNKEKSSPDFNEKILISWV